MYTGTGDSIIVLLSFILLFVIDNILYVIRYSLLNLNWLTVHADGVSVWIYQNQAGGAEPLVMSCVLMFFSSCEVNDFDFICCVWRALIMCHSITCMKRGFHLFFSFYIFTQILYIVFEGPTLLFIIAQSTSYRLMIRETCCSHVVLIELRSDR